MSSAALFSLSRCGWAARRVFKHGEVVATATRCKSTSSHEGSEAEAAADGDEHAHWASERKHMEAYRRHLLASKAFRLAMTQNPFATLAQAVGHQLDRLHNVISFQESISATAKLVFGDRNKPPPFDSQDILDNFYAYLDDIGYKGSGRFSFELKAPDQTPSEFIEGVSASVAHVRKCLTKHRAEGDKFEKRLLAVCTEGEAREGMQGILRSAEETHRFLERLPPNDSVVRLAMVTFTVEHPTAVRLQSHDAFYCPDLRSPTNGSLSQASPFDAVVGGRQGDPAGDKVGKGEDAGDSKVSFGGFGGGVSIGKHGIEFQFKRRPRGPASSHVDQPATPSPGEIKNRFFDQPTAAHPLAALANFVKELFSETPLKTAKEEQKETNESSTPHNLHHLPPWQPDSLPVELFFAVQDEGLSPGDDSLRTLDVAIMQPSSAALPLAMTFRFKALVPTAEVPVGLEGLDLEDALLQYVTTNDLAWPVPWEPSDAVGTLSVESHLEPKQTSKDIAKGVPCKVWLWTMEKVIDRRRSMRWEAPWQLHETLVLDDGTGEEA